MIGVTHTSNNDKYEVSFVVVFMAEALDVDFAVDIVERNDAAGSIFFHDLFTVSAVFPGSSSSSKKGKGSKCKSSKSSKGRTSGNSTKGSKTGSSSRRLHRG